MKTGLKKEISERLKIQKRNQDIWKTLRFSKGLSQKWDTSPEITFIFVLKGHLNIFIDGDVDGYVVSSEEMTMIPASFAYRIEVLEQTHLITCLFHSETLLSEQTLIDELVPFCDKDKTNFAKLSINKTIKSYLLLLDKYIKDGIDSSYFYDLKRHELFLLLFAYFTKRELAVFLSPIIGENIQFKEFVINNYLDVKNVQELASRANYSTSGFIKKFYRYFNESPYQWMQRQKAKQILNEINRGLKSLQEIAGEYNFSSYQHFANFCKTQFGFPPTEIFDKYIMKNNVNINKGKNICQSGNNL